MKRLSQEKLQKAHDEVIAETESVFSKRFPLETLANQALDELQAKETKFVKVKKSEFDPIKLRVPGFEGVKVVLETQDEILLAVDVRAWGVQQNARQDIHKLRGDYPAEKLQHDVSGSIMSAVIAYFGGKDDA